MKIFASLATLALTAASAVAQQFMINTPILPGSQPSAPALENLGQVQGNSFTWTVNIPAGTSIGLTLRDSTGNVVQSAPFTINAGNDNSCIGASSTAGGSTAGNTSPATSGAAPSTSSPATPSSPATSAAPATSAPATATTPAATSRPTTPNASSAAASSGASASTSSSNAAPTQAANIGAAALLGAAAVALLA
ncbi:hypothetical protein C0995_008966 [Termitomyces sp. Mi166|nr:hypothetical protein C0995_008966 [Termitomyces sp. Mi166\